MPTIDDLKEQEAPPTPLFLFDCVLSTGTTHRWSTHSVTVAGNSYLPRLIQHNLFTLQASSQDGLDGAQKISVVLANADSHYSQIERETGFKGAQLTIQFLFYDLAASTAASETRVLFRGIANAPDEITESTLRLSFTNRLNLQRIVLPEVRVERRCPWRFPADSSQRAEAVSGGAKGKYSALYRCGYSPDQAGGVGNLSGGSPFTSCNFTRAACLERGMFDTDSSSHVTRRFGGIEFVPAQIQVRSYGEKGTHLSSLIDNQARYNDSVPLIYGTAWYQPVVVFARNDGNLTHLELLLGMGEIDEVVKVVANGIEIPLAITGTDMTGTGWYNLVTSGSRNGAFNLDFQDGSGQPAGDPYGSIAVLSLVLPNQVSSGASLPKVNVLLRGLKLESFDESGVSLGDAFTNNPAWVLLDVLRRSGWKTNELDLPSFAAAAVHCGTAISTTDLYGNATVVPRFQCNLVVRNRRSAAEIVKGIRNGSSLLLFYGANGLLKVRIEESLAVQQPALPGGSNSTAELTGGWPAYEFGDGTSGTTGIARKANGDPAIRLWSRNGSDTPNRLTVEFQDEFNEYQQDSLALVDVDDSLLTGSELTASFNALGIPNFDQATRVLQLQLAKAIRGYTFIEFDTTVRGVGLSPGDLITVTYLKEGLERQPFRVMKLAPSQDYLIVQITAQWHEDDWYGLSGSGLGGGRRSGGADPGLPRPLVGSEVDANGVNQLGITEAVIEGALGSAVALTVSFVPPPKPAVANSAIPLLSLSPTISSTGGTLHGNQTLYYALTSIDSNGAESGLSFTVRAPIASGTNTNQVTISGLSFSPGTASFQVYRGTNPLALLRIAASVFLASTYTDSGAIPALLAPPDANYDHANLFWRRELQPEAAADIFSSTTIGNSALGMPVNGFAGAIVRIGRGKGATQERKVTANSATALTITPAWSIAPDASSYFTVADSGWNFGAVGSTSPLQIQVPNWGGQTVQISGRSANALDQESTYELNPLTSWQLGSGGAGGIDRDVPPLPVFALFAAGQGTVDLQAIAFPTLTNTHTISAGTLTTYYWNELDATPPALSAAVNSTDTTLTLAAASAAVVDQFVQLDGEVMQVTAVASGGTELTVTRAAQSSTATSHSIGAVVYPLSFSTTTVPFIPDFFGSPASGSYIHSIYLPDVRIGAAEFFVTNANGNSPTRHAWFGATDDKGLRTLSGGQVALQVEGYMAVQTNATPPFVVEATHSVMDIFAIVQEAPSGGSLELTVKQNGTEYCVLTIVDGATVSDSVNGFGLPPLNVNSQIDLDITAVPTASGSTPGRDLSVTIRL